MRRQTFFKAMLAISIIFAGFTAKAQLDTAWYQDTHSNQYIYPPLADSNYRFEGINSIVPLSHINSMSIDNGSGDQFSGGIRRVAQRYEVKDSLKIIGVAAMVVHSPSIYGQQCDTITIGIWDETLSSELYSQAFVSGGRTSYANCYRFIEYLFDDTIILYGDYHVSMTFDLNPCPTSYWGLETSLVNFCLKEYTPCDFGGTDTTNYCPPSGCGPKYPLYISYCNGNRASDWVRAIDVNNWYQGLSYQNVFTYPHQTSVICDTLVFASAGLCPIKVFEDTVSQDTTSSSVLSVELLERAVRLYPNPANEVLNVACDYDIESIAVFDVLNRLVEERKVNSKTLQLSLANYAQGTYFITITTEKGKLNKKFVVQ